MKTKPIIYLKLIRQENPTFMCRLQGSTYTVVRNSLDIKEIVKEVNSNVVKQYMNDNMLQPTTELEFNEFKKQVFELTKK